MTRHSHLVALLSLSLAACASTPAGVVDPGIGRHIATVVQVGDAASFGPWQDNDCRRSAAATPRRGASESQRYASVQYFAGRHAHRRIVPIDDDLIVAPGDQVTVKTYSCSEALTR